MSFGVRFFCQRVFIVCFMFFDIVPFRSLGWMPLNVWKLVSPLLIDDTVFHGSPSMPSDNIVLSMMHGFVSQGLPKEGEKRNAPSLRRRPIGVRLWKSETTFDARFDDLFIRVNIYWPLTIYTKIVFLPTGFLFGIKCELFFISFIAVRFSIFIAYWTNETRNNFLTRYSFCQTMKGNETKEFRFVLVNNNCVYNECQNLRRKQHRGDEDRSKNSRNEFSNITFVKTIKTPFVLTFLHFIYEWEYVTVAEILKRSLVPCVSIRKNESYLITKRSNNVRRSMMNYY